MDLESAAAKRKERLLALKKKSKNSEDGELTSTASPQSIEIKKPQFRSYQPQHDQFKTDSIPKSMPGRVEDALEENLKMTKDVSVLDEIDLTKLQPRKIDWDLKRDVSKKLEKLDRRTQRAIAEIIRERLADEKAATNDLLGAVNAASADIDDD